MHVSSERARLLTERPPTDQRVKLFKEHSRLDAAGSWADDEPELLARRKAARERLERLRRGLEG